MPYTVWGAFDQFRRNVVDIDRDRSNRAKPSRDFLVTQLESLASCDLGFPKLYGGHIPFGSFARKTKVRPLDDIDLLLPLNGSGTESVRRDNYKYWLFLKDGSAPLANFPDNYGYVNSTKVLNRIATSLSNLPHYKKANPKKDGHTIRIDLLSYDWSFDVVPAVPVAGGTGTAYYLIPDGYGNWIATDPRIDAANMTRVNQQHDGELLAVMRLLKYWNGCKHKPKLASYYFETLVLTIFESTLQFGSIQNALKYFFKACQTYLWLPCPDPKNLGHDLDQDVSGTTKLNVDAALITALTYADYAIMYEGVNDHKNAIYWWGQIFGTGFPDYGS